MPKHTAPHRNRTRPVRSRVMWVVVCSALLVAGCGHTVLQGRALSMLYDPYRVAGLPVTEVPSGIKPDAPPPTGTVGNTDDGAVDRLALLSINDLEEFWAQHYPESFHGRFHPVSHLVSYDSDDPDSPRVCGMDMYGLANAGYCQTDDVMAWDRGVFLPVAEENFRSMAIPAVLAHEYGHALQWMGGLVDEKTPVVVREQQADCLAGVYLRWVAEGKSPRFSLSTGEGLNYVLAGVIASRDPTLTPLDADMLRQGHGTALDRVSAFQIGFDEGVARCTRIDMNDVNKRRGDLPMSLQFDQEGNVQTGEVKINPDTLSTLMEILAQVFSPATPPILRTEPAPCTDAEPTEPASYCPATNTINVNLPALQAMGQLADLENDSLVNGDNTALSVVISRYTLAVQREQGASLTSPTTALRTACLTGVAQRKMAEAVKVPSGKTLVLAAGDIDEAVSGLLINGLVASDVDGQTVPAGFTRIVAFRLGLHGQAGQCFQRFS